MVKPELWAALLIHYLLFFYLLRLVAYYFGILFALLCLGGDEKGSFGNEQRVRNAS